jgi:Vam6/Vps39-like protein vacuolar protein sorting-associated protein 39
VFNSTETHYRLSEKEADVKDRLGPSITYLQRLSPEYLDTIFQYSKWILNENAEMALEVRSAVDIFYTTC